MVCLGNGLAREVLSPSGRFWRVDMFLNNIRCACRNLRAAPGFTLTAILSLGFGIGATLAMFTVVSSILLKPLSFRDPDRLVFITQSGFWQNPYNRSVG